MPWSLSRKLYTAAAMAGLVVAGGAITTVVQVRHLATITEKTEKTEELLRKANLQLYWQANAISAHRGHAAEGGNRYIPTYQEALAREDEISQSLEYLLQNQPAALDSYRKWQNRFERWLRESSTPYWEAVTRGAKVKADLSISMQKELYPLFTAFADGKRAELRELSKDASQSRTQAQITAWLSALVSLILGGGLFIWVLRKANQDLRESIQSSATSTTEIAAALNEHEHILNDQAAALNEIATTLAELNATSTQASDSGEAIVHRSSGSMATVRQWNEGLKESVAEMSDLKGTVEAIAKQILELSEQTGQIGSILGTVSDIASQTNLLALNAAVEAARAGEHGKGFAVVAAEIRKLADQSKRALERIGTIVSQIQKATNSTVMTAEEGSKRVDSTIHGASQSMGTVGHIISSLEETVMNTQQIVLNLRQQAAGVRQVNEAMSSINTGVKESVAGMSQIRAGVRQLQTMSDQLKALVGQS